MADYPQHLSMASILRWYHDPARHLVENYTFAYSRPNTAFVFLVGALSYLVPLGLAGKLLIAGAVSATGLAGLALARHAGRPGWFGLFALIAAYDYAFFFGFVNYVLATPLFLYGIVLADRLLDRNVSWRSCLTLAAYGAAFYFVHLQVLFLFIGLVVWLALLRHRRWQSTLPLCSALLPGLLLGTYHFITRNPQSFRYHEKRIYSHASEADLIFDRLVAIPRFCFGENLHHGHWLVFLAALLAIFWLLHIKRPRDGKVLPTPSQEEGMWARARGTLWRHRFLTIAAWILAGYLMLPGTFIGSYVYHRLAVLLWLLLPALLPRVDAFRVRPAQALLATALLAQTLLVSDHALALDQEARDGHELLRQAEPGKSLMSLVTGEIERGSDAPPPFLHFAAYYLAANGGRINCSFTELYVSPVQLRPGKEFEDVYATVSEWAPSAFTFAELGYHFDYFLFHGDFAKLASMFGPSMPKLAWRIRGNWALLWRKPAAATSQ
jgi:hypothetical protein